MREANAGIRRCTEGFDASETIAFYCECRTASCYAPVWLSAAEFDAVVAAKTVWVLSAGHEPSVRWRSGEAHEAGSMTSAIPLVRGWEPEAGDGGQAA